MTKIDIGIFHVKIPEKSRDNHLPSNKEGDGIMCPYYNSSTRECRVTPFDGDAPRTDREVEATCTDSSNHRNCGNYEAARRGDYEVRR